MLDARLLTSHPHAKVVYITMPPRSDMHWCLWGFLSFLAREGLTIRLDHVSYSYILYFDSPVCGQKDASGLMVHSGGCLEIAESDIATSEVVRIQIRHALVEPACTPSRGTRIRFKQFFIIDDRSSCPTRKPARPAETERYVRALPCLSYIPVSIVCRLSEDFRRLRRTRTSYANFRVSTSNGRILNSWETFALNKKLLKH